MMAAAAASLLFHFSKETLYTLYTKGAAFHRLMKAIFLLTQYVTTLSFYFHAYGFSK